MNTYILKITVSDNTHTAQYEALNLDDAIAEAKADHGDAVVEEL